MTVDSNLPSNRTDEIFAQALERMEAGEPLEGIIATAPAALHAELRDLLTVVAATHPLQKAELPRRDPARRAANRQAFLQAAATLRAEVETQSPVVTNAVAAVPPVVTPATKAVTPTAAPAGRAKTAVAAPTWLDQLRAGWQNLTGSLAFSPMQLAPLVIMLTAISLSTFGFATAAQASVPGDIIYGAKQWLRQQELNLAAEEDRPDIVKKQEEETAKEIAAAQERATEPIQETETLFFRGWEEGNLLLGSLVVKPAYQLNPPDAATAPMTMDATPTDGQQVILVYQIVPTQNITDTLGRQVVQGISLTVIEDSIVVPTVTPTPCTRAVPDGWQPLVIRTGDTINAISIRTGADEPVLTQVNCLANPNLIYPGMLFFAPVPATATPTPSPLPSLAATLTAVSTTVSTEVVTPTQTVEPDATATLTTTIGLTPTVGISATATLTPTAAVTETAATPTVTTTETISGTVVPPAVTAQPTPDLTVTLTTMAGTPGATTVMTTTTVPAAATTPTPPMATAEATATAASDDTTDDANETPTTNVTAAPTPVVDASGNGSDTGSTPAATIAPPTATPTPASEGRSGGRSGDAVTLTPTAIDRSPLPASSG